MGFQIDYQTVYNKFLLIKILYTEWFSAQLAVHFMICDFHAILWKKIRLKGFKSCFEESQ